MERPDKPLAPMHDDSLPAFLRNAAVSARWVAERLEAQARILRDQASKMEEVAERIERPDEPPEAAVV